MTIENKINWEKVLGETVLEVSEDKPLSQNTRDVFNNPYQKKLDKNIESWRDFKETKKTETSFLVSVFVLVWVIALTIWLYIYNNMLQSSIAEYNTKKTEIETNISKIKENDSVILYYVLKNNKAILDKYAYIWNITKIINNFKIISKTYDVNFSSFSYANWVLSTQAFVLDDGTVSASDKIIKLFTNFRWTNKDMFKLDFVNTFEWQNKISFTTTFNLK